MENQTFSRIPGFVSILECAFYQLRAVIFSNPVCDDLSRKEIHNHTDIELHFIQFEVSNIADPDLIRLVHIKLAIDYILCFSVLIHILLLSALSNAFYEKVVKRIMHMKKAELQQTLLDLLLTGPEWQYDRFVRSEELW